MQKHGVNLSLIRQDDTGKMQEDLIACAREIAGGSSQCSNGANFVIIMGDGSGHFLAAVNPQLKKLGNDYQAKVIGATGYNRGEDSLMAPAEVKSNPQAAKGLLGEGVSRDGDWNIAQKWEGDNGIKNNPDEKNSGRRCRQLDECLRLLSCPTIRWPAAAVRDYSTNFMFRPLSIDG